VEIGKPLTDMQVRELEKTRWINRTWATEARLRAVDHLEGKEIIGRPSGDRGDYAGIWIPYYWPGSDSFVTGRLRRDNPEIDARTKGPKNKYMSAPSDRLHVYVPPRYTLEQLMDPTIPLIWVEGEFKALAMARLAFHGVDQPRFVVLAIAGVWAWRGTIGAENNSSGSRVSVKGVLPEVQCLDHKNRNELILFDMDAPMKPQVRAARHALSLELRRLGANVGWFEWNPKEGKGPDDRIAAMGPDLMLADIAKAQFDEALGWKADLVCTDTGKPKPLLCNATLVIENSPLFSGLRFDEFGGNIIRPSSVPWVNQGPYWNDADNVELSSWLQQQRVEVGSAIAYEAARCVAQRNNFHPVRDYLNALVWDGEPRIDQWLMTYAGAKFTNYNSIVGRCWLISAVARIFEPGCKADSALLLIGVEGRGKSSLCKVMAGEWFSDNLPDLGDKDAAQHVQGKWILELGELAALGRTALTHIKAWMSRGDDIYRPPYGRMVVNQPRQCVFIATTNESEPLKDTTGNRRFWPVTTGFFEIPKLREDRDQLWAEAVAMYRDGVKWHLEKEAVKDAEKEQADRVEHHVWHDVISVWLTGREYSTVSEILTSGINKPPATQNQLDKNNVVKVLQSLGWILRTKRLNGRRTKVYYAPDWLPEGDDEE
jgi:predicted P-loop ATPase